SQFGGTDPDLRKFSITRCRSAGASSAKAGRARIRAAAKKAILLKRMSDFLLYNFRARQSVKEHGRRGSHVQGGDRGLLRDVDEFVAGLLQDRLDPAGFVAQDEGQREVKL